MFLNMLPFSARIPFYIIHVQSHDVTRLELWAIDLFTIDSDDVSPNAFVASDNHLTSDLIPIPACNPPPSIAKDLPPSRPTQNRRPTKLLEFVNSCYLPDFACFIVNVHRIFAPTSYKEIVSYPLD